MHTGPGLPRLLKLQASHRIYFPKLCRCIVAKQYINVTTYVVSLQKSMNTIDTLLKLVIALPLEQMYISDRLGVSEYYRILKSCAKHKRRHRPFDLALSVCRIRVVSRYVKMLCSRYPMRFLQLSSLNFCAVFIQVE